MRFLMTTAITVLAVTVLTLLFIRPFTVYVTNGEWIYVVNTFTGSGKACHGPRCRPLEERR